MKKRINQAFATALIAGSLTSIAAAQNAVIPAANATTAGGASPFDTLTREFERSYQQVYSGAELASQGLVAGSLITGITFRSSNFPAANPTGTWPPANLSWVDYEIYLGKSAVTVGSMSTTYAANVVSGTEIQVRDGALTIPAGSFSNTVVAPAVNPWGYEIPVTPFVYGGGDLIMTVRHGGHASTALVRNFLDVVANPTGTSTQCMANSTMAATTGTATQSAPAVVRFTFSAGGPTGACCLGAPSYSCIVTTPGGCSGQGGTYAGNNVTCAAANCPPPPTGACCAANGSCSIITQAACTTAGGTYSGNNVTCAAANCVAIGWAEVGDAGETPTTAQEVTAAAATPCQYITGAVTAGDADVYKIRICDEANFLATTAGTTPATTIDTQIFLFNSTGFGVVMDDDDVGATGTLQSRITTLFVTANGDYYLGVAGYDNDPVDSVGGYLWNDQNATPAYGPEWAPNGPAAANAWSTFDHTATSAAGSYKIALGGVCFKVATVACYANCDGSTSNPVLTANDFQCFLNEYAQGTAYANCDGSTQTPVLTANDFQCFLNAYAIGCT